MSCRAQWENAKAQYVWTYLGTVLAQRSGERPILQWDQPVVPQIVSPLTQYLGLFLKGPTKVLPLGIVLLTKIEEDGCRFPQGEVIVGVVNDRRDSALKTLGQRPVLMCVRPHTVRVYYQIFVSLDTFHGVHIPLADLHRDRFPI